MEDYKKTELLSSRTIPQGTEDDHEDTTIATPLLSPPLQIKLNYVAYHAYEFDSSIPAYKSKESAPKRFFRFLPAFTVVVVKIGVLYWLVWLAMRYIVTPEVWLLIVIQLSCPSHLQNCMKEEARVVHEKIIKWIKSNS